MLLCPCLNLWPTSNTVLHAAEIIMIEQNVAIFRTSNETRFFVVGSALVRLHSSQSPLYSWPDVAFICRKMS